MKPALIARLLVDEFYSKPVGIASRGQYLAFLRTIANGSNRNTNVQKGYAAAVRQIEGR